MVNTLRRLGDGCHWIKPLGFLLLGCWVVSSSIENCHCDVLIFFQNPVRELAIVYGSIVINISLSEEYVHNMICEEVLIDTLQNPHHFHLVNYAISIGIKMRKRICYFISTLCAHI